MVRVCEVTYDKALLEKDGITVVVRVHAAALGRAPCLSGQRCGAGTLVSLRAACHLACLCPGTVCVWTHLREVQASGCVASSESPPL